MERRKLFPVLIEVVLTVSLLAGVACQDQNGIAPTGLLCISECSTCPVICSPPHSAKSQPRQPPPVPVIEYSPPPSYKARPPPPPLPPPPPPPAEGSPPPPHVNITSGLAPPMIGSGVRSYPYYYFYASKVSPLPFPANFFAFVVFLHCLCL
ncbi:hypothetical protein Nepgr_014219 [Nepenthes gracilis]|uniref:Leucine-rich repeat extensin-like protein 3 n=1 Tax=Nepenthes gracilis TaxID=150966 RepID=A0AAD3SJ73_NEPGR|nr:hypothetical protein Nepgr_014219 [Nepenthes gracilis]